MLLLSALAFAGIEWLKMQVRSICSHTIRQEYGESGHFQTKCIHSYNLQVKSFANKKSVILILLLLSNTQNHAMEYNTSNAGTV